MELIRFPENSILLPLAGFLFSIPCFYIVTQIPEHAQTGRFTLLAYVSEHYTMLTRTLPVFTRTTLANGTTPSGKWRYFARPPSLLVLCGQL